MKWLGLLQVRNHLEIGDGEWYSTEYKKLVLRLEMVVIAVISPIVQIETRLVKVLMVIIKALDNFLIPLDVSLMFVGNHRSVALYLQIEAGRRQSCNWLPISRCSDGSIAADTRATSAANQS